MAIEKQKISLIQQRVIEADMAVALIKGFAASLGRAGAMHIAGEVIKSLARDGGRKMAVAPESGSLSALACIVRETWAKDDALRIDFLEETESRLRFNVMRCRYAEAYERAGLSEYGECLSCNRDAAFIEGFNPRITLRRTQTMMQGAPYCDFCFLL